MIEQIRKAASYVAGLVGLGPDAQETQGVTKAVKFYAQLIETGEVWPVKVWKEARDAYRGGEDVENADRTRIRNGRWRATVDSKAAYVDQELPKVVCKPAKGLEEDEQAPGVAECEEAVYARIRELQDFGRPLGRARHSADLTNLGIIVHQWDLGNGLPDLIRLKPECVKMDADCDGDLERAGWVAYKEYLAPQVLAAQYADIPVAEFRKAAKAVSQLPDVKGENVEGETRRRRAVDDLAPALQKCVVWNLFLTGAYAGMDPLKDAKPDTDQADEQEVKRFRETHRLDEARRYVRIVEGMKDRFLENEAAWPKPYLFFKPGEWPITLLRWNEDDESMAGFTDWVHEVALLDSQEKTLQSMHTREQLRRPLRWGRSATCSLSDTELRTFLEGDELSVLELLDANGIPMLKVIEVEGITQQDLDFREVLQQEYDAVSMLSELQREGTQTYDTATEARIAQEAASAKSNRRLRKFETFHHEVSRKVLAMAHAMIPKLTAVEARPPAPVTDPMMPAALPVGPQPLTVVDVPLVEAVRLLLDPTAEAQVVQWGVEALVGPELAVFWLDDTTPPALLQTLVTVNVERGSTQRTERLWRSQALQQLLPEIEKVAMALGRPDLVSEALKRILGLMDMDEFEDLIPTAQPGMPMLPPGGVPVPAAPGQPMPPAPTPALGGPANPAL